MTDEQIIELLATKVMGWTLSSHGNYWNLPGQPGEREQIFRLDWNPIKHIQHAWMVVEKMRDEGYNAVVCGDNGWGCTFFQVDIEETDAISGTWTVCYGPINAETAQRAICLAALKAHGIEAVSNEDPMRESNP